MSHRLSADDRRFRHDFEHGGVAPASFDHRAHVRLAYVHLVDREVEDALASVRQALHAFLRHHGIDVSKYHETMTRAWVLAVRHFMTQSRPASSADDFIDANPTLLDSKIMLTHYSAEVLFSAEARTRFVEPDLQQIPPPPRDPVAP